MPFKAGSTLDSINPSPISFTGRSGTEWARKPALPDTHVVNTRIYTDPDIFQEEIQKIWNKVWLPVCHESELPEILDFRTSGLAGNKPIVVVRGEDNRIRTFLNICSHRNNIIVRSPSGSLKNAQPSGNPSNMTCMYHGWQFDATGRCVEIPRETVGYQERVCKESAGLRQIKTEVGYGGMVWVNLDDNCGPLSEYIGHSLDLMMEQLETEPLEIFHYQKSIVRCNYKLFFDTSREFYHDYLHFHNRQTSMIKPGYFDQEYSQFPNGHSVTGFTTVDYSSHGDNSTRFLTFPGLPKNGWRHTTLFPASAYNIRTSCLRVNVVMPISDRETLVEIRGFGLKRDTPEERTQRVKDYISVWGPFGWNLHEDLLCAQVQTQAIQQGSGAEWSIIAREENNKVHDEIGLRTYYAEWNRLMGRKASDGSSGSSE
jgi:methanesulfonate monooxygenase large subunit